MTSWAGRRVLVTGAGGFIGSHLAERLVSLGSAVKVFLRYNSQARAGLIDSLPEETRDHIEVCWGDLRDPEAVRKAVRGNEVVFHLGSLIAIPYSYVNPVDYVQTNLIGTINVLHACMDAAVRRMVHTSTSEVYGTAQYVPIDERHPLQGQSPYSATKIGADKLVESYWRSFDTPVSILRPFNTYGPRQSTRAVIPTIITQALIGERVRLGSLDTVRDLNYVGDTVEGFIRIADADVMGDPVNVGSGRGVTVGEVVQMVGSILGKQLQVETDPARIRPTKSEVGRLICDNRKAKAVLGWEPRVRLEEGLARTVEWLSRNVDMQKTGRYTI